MALTSQFNVTLAGWLRNLGLGAITIRQADPELIRALGRIGTNLNQTTKHANFHRQLDQQVLSEITAIRKIQLILLNKTYEVATDDC